MRAHSKTAAGDELGSEPGASRIDGKSEPSRMARYEVFRQVAESLGNLVRLEAKAQKADVDVVLGPFDETFFASKKSQVAVYLYDHELDPNVSQDEDERTEEVSDQTGTYTILYGRPLYLVVRFAVAATGKTPLDEQANLGLAMKAFFERPVLKDELKLGADLGEGQLPVDLDPEFGADRKRALLESLGVRHHPVVGYRLPVSMPPERELGRTRRVERRTMELYDRHRPPEGRGLGEERRIPPPKVAKGKG